MGCVDVAREADRWMLHQFNLPRSHLSQLLIDIDHCAALRLLAYLTPSMSGGR